MGALSISLVDVWIARSAPSARAVGDEEDIELRPLCGLSKFDVVLDVEAGVGLRFGMTPSSDMMSRRLDERPETELTFFRAHKGFPDIVLPIRRGFACRCSDRLPRPAIPVTSISAIFLSILSTYKWSTGLESLSLWNCHSEGSFGS